MEDKKKVAWKKNDADEMTPWETEMVMEEEAWVMGVFPSSEEEKISRQEVNLTPEEEATRHPRSLLEKRLRHRHAKKPRFDKDEEEWENREWPDWEMTCPNESGNAEGMRYTEEGAQGGDNAEVSHFSLSLPSSPQHRSSIEIPTTHHPLTPSRVEREVEKLTRYLHGLSVEDLSETDLQPQFLPEWRQPDISAPLQRVPGTFNWLEISSDEEARRQILDRQSLRNRLQSSTRSSVTAMSFYPHSRPVITFGNKRGEMIEELFDSIDTEEEMRLAALDEPTLGATKYEAAKALGPKLQKMRLRSSLEGAALEYYLNQLQPDVRMDYEKSKKALLRRFSSQVTSAADRTEEARWVAIARMTSLKQGASSIKDYVLELEALEDALPVEMHPKLVESWLRGFTDERDGRTMRVAAKQEKATSPADVAKAARTYFFAVEKPTWVQASSNTQTEIPVLAAVPAPGSAPRSGPAQNPAVMQQGELLELLRQVSLQLSITSGIQQSPSSYPRPAHQRSQSDAMVYQQQPVNVQFSAQPTANQEKDPFRCYNCQLSGHRAINCPSYNPRRDGPLTTSVLPAGPPLQLSAANSVEVASLRERLPDVNVQRLSQVDLAPNPTPGGNVLTNAVVDLFTDDSRPVSAENIAAMLLGDVATAEGKRARVEDYYDPARDTSRPKPQLVTKVPTVTRDHYMNLMKDPEFRQVFLQEATEKLREDCAREAAQRRKQRAKVSIPKIKALTEDEDRFLGLRLLKRIPFMIAHPGLEDGIFSLADLLDISPRLRQQVVEAMKSSESRRAKRQSAPMDIDEQMVEDVSMVAEFFACLVSSASELYALEESPQDTWLAEEEIGHAIVKSLFYTFGMLKVASKNGAWMAVGAMLVDAGALLNLITMVIVKAVGAESDLVPVSGMHYRTAAGSYHPVLWKWRTTIKISRCQANITFFVTDTDAPYSVLLSRRFMAQAKVRADYELHTYTMGDIHGARIKLPKHNPALTRPVSSGDIPVLVTFSETAVPVVMGPPVQDVDVASVSADQTRVLVLEATRALLAKVKSGGPLLLDDQLPLAGKA